MPHACAIAADHSLWCWGHTDAGQIGKAPGPNTPTAQQVGSETTWAHVACGLHFTCALKLDGTRWCFGLDEDGELGDGRGWREDFTVIP